MKKIAFVVATPTTINAFMRSHVFELAKSYHISVIANEELGELDKDLPVTFIHVPIVRDISLINDLSCIIKLRKVLSNGQFDIVHTITPKAALIGMISARLCGVKNRFHTFTGQVWATKSGLFRLLLKSLDKLVFSLTTAALIDSPSQRDFLIKNKVVNNEGALVLGSGSISGVDLNKFYFSDEARDRVRKNHSIPDSSFTFIFLGRLCSDKGIDELLRAFKCVSSEYPQTYLLLVGPNEGKYDIEYFKQIKNPRIILCGMTNTPQDYFSASECLVLPSYREGFGTTVLEAAACGIPTLASDIYGLSDAVVNEQTGILHKVRSSIQLAEHMKLLITDSEHTKSLGEAALLRVQTNFSSDYLSEELVKFYRENISV
ncbi:glycosyltransferase family 4 protein [Vibrio sp. 10N.222.55.F12]|uniref:glycosyltransferase family 4 protein n=1 Tax=Vibrio sp. 10N.222.55.F12 TaxID=3229653 RepID=UPI00355315DD